MKHYIKAMKRYFDRIANLFRVVTHTGNYWYWLSESKYQALQIKDLVYPLRYDILIRKEFFSFYIENRELSKEECSELYEEITEMIQDMEEED